MDFYLTSDSGIIFYFAEAEGSTTPARCVEASACQVVETKDAAWSVSASLFCIDLRP